MNIGSLAVKRYFRKKLWSISCKDTNNFKLHIIKSCLKIYKGTK